MDGPVVAWVETTETFGIEQVSDNKVVESDKKVKTVEDVWERVSNSSKVVGETIVEN